MGELYKARDPQLERTVAIKISQAVHGMFRRRSGCGRRCQPPAYLHAPRRRPDYLVMEYLEGETLAARLTKGPLPGREAQICRANGRRSQRCSPRQHYPTAI